MVRTKKKGTFTALTKDTKNSFIANHLTKTSHNAEFKNNFRIVDTAKKQNDIYKNRTQNSRQSNVYYFCTKKLDSI